MYQFGLEIFSLRLVLYGTKDNILMNCMYIFQIFLLVCVIFVYFWLVTL